MKLHLNTPTVSLTIPRSIDLALGSHLRRFELNAEREQERAIAASLRSRIEDGGTLNRGPRLTVTEAELRVLAWVIGEPLHPCSMLRPLLQTPRETAGFRSLRGRIARHAGIVRRKGEGGFRLVVGTASGPLGGAGPSSPGTGAHASPR